MKKKKKVDGLSIILKILLFIIKIPFFILKGGYIFIKYILEKTKNNKIKNNRQKIIAKYEEFELVKVIEGDYQKFLSDLFKSESKIGIILGSRGSGKSAIGVKILENVYSKTKKKCYAMGFNENEMPSFIKIITDISQIENNSYILIDEGGILYNSRNFMSSANKILSQLLMISRHKNLSILFISQNSSNLEVNILRQADFLLLKKSSLLQKEFERKIIEKFYEKVENDFEKYSDDKGITYVYSNNFKGFISNPLPNFWKESISKSFM